MAPTFHYIDNSHHTTFETDYNNTNSVELYYKFHSSLTSNHTFTVEKLTGYQYFDDVSIPQPDHEFVFYNRTHSNGTSTFTDTYNDSIVASASGTASIQAEYALQFNGGYLDVTPWTIGSAFTIEFVVSYQTWSQFSKIIDFDTITFGDASVTDSGGTTNTPSEVAGLFTVGENTLRSASRDLRSST